MSAANELRDTARAVIASMEGQGFTGQPRGSHAMWVVKNDLAWRLHDLLAGLSEQAEDAVEEGGPVKPEDRWLWEELGSLVVGVGLERWRVYRALGAPRIVRDVKRAADGEWEEDAVFEGRRVA